MDLVYNNYQKNLKIIKENKNLDVFGSLYLETPVLD
jgi:hypothetical protein